MSNMGMTRPKRPTTVVIGTVQEVTPRTKRDTGEVYRTDVTVETPGAGMLAVEFWERKDSTLDLPPVLANVVMIAEVSESAQYGSSLGFVRYATPGDLDAILSASGALAASGK